MKRDLCATKYILLTLSLNRPLLVPAHPKRSLPVPALAIPFAGTLEVAQAEALAETDLRVWTTDGVHAEENVPQIFHHAAGDRRGKIGRRVPEPLAREFVADQWCFEDLSARDGELGAAGGAYYRGDFFGDVCV